MNIRATVLVGSLMLLSALSMAAESVHLYLKTSGQGHIAGSSLQKGKEKWIEVMSWRSAREALSGLATGRRSALWTESVDIVSPRDHASGLPTGKRMHKPFLITIELDRAGLQIAQALAMGEVITECKMVITGDDGKMETATLTGAALDQVVLSRSETGGRPTEEISFTYQKIEWTK